MENQTQASEQPAAPKKKGAAAATVTLSDGRVLVMRRAIGRDLEKATIVSGAASQTHLMLGLVAQIGTIDDKPVPYEDIQEMDLYDVSRLLSEVEQLMGKSPSLGRVTSSG